MCVRGGASKSLRKSTRYLSGFNDQAEDKSSRKISLANKKTQESSKSIERR